MPVSEAKRRNNDKYNATCDYISIRPKKEIGAEIRAAAAEAGQSLQGYILQACRERMERQEEIPPEDDIKKAADAAGESVNAYISKAITQRMITGK